jgi:uncharacterized protein with GYD domain
VCAPEEGRLAVGKYLYRLQYNKPGLDGTLKEGFAAREAYFRKAVERLGGTTEAAYWAYGDVDVFVIVDIPEQEKATSLALALAETGSYRLTTTTLLTAAEMDAAARHMPSYRAPGAAGSRAGGQARKS